MIGNSKITTLVILETLQKTEITFNEIYTKCHVFGNPTSGCSTIYEIVNEEKKIH